jgi:hypothetical protein
LDKLYNVSSTLQSIKQVVQNNSHSAAVTQTNSFLNSTAYDITKSTDPTLGNNDISAIIAQMNGWTDSSTNIYQKGCNPASFDTWVQSNNLCPNGYTYTAGGGTLGNKDCIPFTEFTGSQASTRYSVQTACASSGSTDFTSVGQAASAYTTNLNKYVTDNSNLVNQLIANSNIIDNSFVSMSSKLLGSLDKVNGIITPLVNIFQSLVGDQGIFAFINCCKIFFLF